MEDGKFITAAGVSVGIDMALLLTARMTSQDNSQSIHVHIVYDPQPPPSVHWTGAKPTSIVNTNPRLGDAEARRRPFDAIMQDRPGCLLEKMLA